jgi:WhiB family redox-sensing transcriptional regulator
MPKRRAAVPGGRNLGVTGMTWDWHEKAACANGPSELFYGPDGEKPPARIAREERALAICGRCLVRNQCRNHALSFPEAYGVWGGTTESGRSSTRRGLTSRVA